MKIYGYDTYELFQIDVNTVAGASYDLSFWFRFASDEGNNHLEVLWNDDTIATFQDVPLPRRVGPIYVSHYGYRRPQHPDLQRGQ